MKKYKTVMKIECAWCGDPMGTKDGKGVEGTTSGICRKCKKRITAEMGIPPAWNIIGRWLYRRRMRKTRAMEDTRDAVESIFTADPALHSRIILGGRDGVHYVDQEVVGGLIGDVKDEPEMKPRWN